MFSCEFTLRPPWKPVSVLSPKKSLFSIKYKLFAICFLSRFLFTDTKNSHDSRRSEGTIFILLRTFRHLFATLYLKWLPRNFNCIASNYQSATRKALPTLRISIWLIVNVMLVPSCHEIPAGSYEIASLIQIDLAKFIRELTDHEADILDWRFQNITI